MKHIQSYPLSFIFRDAASIVRASRDLSETTILTHINNLLDYWGKAGFKVNHDYNQVTAVKRVRNLVKSL